MYKKRLLSELSEIVDPVLYKPEDVIAYGYDASLGRSFPDFVVLPRSLREVVEVVKFAVREGIPYVARGAGTGLSGGALPVRGGICISLTRMNRIIDVDPDNLRIVVEPGVINEEISRVASSFSLFYPPDPSSRSVSTIGGNIGENASGPHCLKYGSTADHLCGIELVLPDGEVANFGGKYAEAYGPDICSLVAGAEGTLGIVTKATLRLVPLHEEVSTALVVFKECSDAMDAVSSIISAGIIPSALEAMDRPIIEAVEKSINAGYPKDAGAVLLVELDGPAGTLKQQVEKVSELCRQNRATDFIVAKDSHEREKLWAGRRSVYASSARLSPNVLVEDGSVPRSKLAMALKRIMEISKRHNLFIGNVFHAGDGNFHPMIFFDSRNDEELTRVRRAGEEMLEVCMELGGGLSGEHGIGTEKLSMVQKYFSHDTINFFHGIKKIFDPEYLSNPEKLIPALSLNNESWDTPSTDPASLTSERPAVTGADFYIYPENLEELADNVSWLVDNRKRFYPCGSMNRIGSKGFTLHGAGLLSCSRMSRVMEYDAADFSVTVESGITLGDLSRVLFENKQFLPLFPPGRDDLTVGGVVSENIFGPERLKYGGYKEHISGMKIVIPGRTRGETIKAGGRLLKDVSGYDVAKLFIGADGRIGVIGEVTLRTYPVFERAGFAVFAPEKMEDAVLLCRRLLWFFPLSMELFSGAASAGFLNRPQDIEDGWILLIGFGDNTGALKTGIKGTLEHMESIAGRMIEHFELSFEEYLAFKSRKGETFPEIGKIIFQCVISTTFSSMADLICSCEGLDTSQNLYVDVGNGILRLSILQREQEGISRERRDEILGLVKKLQEIVSKHGAACKLELVCPEMSPEITHLCNKGGLGILRKLEDLADPHGLLTRIIHE